MDAYGTLNQNPPLMIFKFGCYTRDNRYKKTTGIIRTTSITGRNGITTKTGITTTTMYQKAKTRNSKLRF